MGQARGEQTEARARHVQAICQTPPPAGLTTSQPANANANKTPLSFFFLSFQKEQSSTQEQTLHTRITTTTTTNNGCPTQPLHGSATPNEAKPMEVSLV
jgi:hypothetical protein